MKLSILRAAAHNIADSFCNGCSFLVGWYDTSYVWRDVEAQAEKELTFDLLSGPDLPTYSHDTKRFLQAMREVVPGQLRREGCNPDMVSKFCLTLRKSQLDPITGQEVLVTVADTCGKEITDIYVGSPLRRIQTVDLLGRRRRLRHLS